MFVTKPNSFPNLIEVCKSIHEGEVISKDEHYILFVALTIQGFMSLVK